MPAISVIATVLNEAAEIPALLRSLQEQSLLPDEVMIVDGGSTDGTWEALLAAEPGFPQLRPIRDTSCSRRFSTGPIARGRNVAVRAARHDLIACVDAGCRYGPAWLDHLTAPLRNGTAEYALGGSCLHLPAASVWDVAAAPFLGIKLDPTAPTKSCTARSMAFTREAWLRAGTFPESLFIGEDVLFDQQMRRTARTAFASSAKAMYTPGNNLRMALRQIGSYAIADGVAAMRPVRLLRHVLRCVAMLLALAALLTVVIASRSAMLVALWCAFAVALLETYFAFRLDGRDLLRRVPARRLFSALPARLFFSLLIPGVVATHQIAGALRKQYRTNQQNA